MKDEFILWMKNIEKYKDNVIKQYLSKIDRFSSGLGVDILEENDIQLISGIYNVIGAPELYACLRFLYYYNYINVNDLIANQLQELFPDYNLFSTENKLIENYINKKRIDIVIENKKENIIEIIRIGTPTGELFSRISSDIKYFSLIYKNISGIIITKDFNDKDINDKTTRLCLHYKTKNIKIKLLKYNMKVELKDV